MSLLRIVKMLPKGPLNQCLCRPYSMWPPEFEDSVGHKSWFKEMAGTEELKRKKLVPIKSAPNDATCSVFSDPLILRFRREVMLDGEKEKAVNQYQLLFKLIKRIQLEKYYKAPPERRHLIQTDPSALIHLAIDNAKPLMNLQTVRVGSVVYNVPTPITPERALFQSMKWILTAARERDRSKSMFAAKLAELVVETAHGTGPIIHQKNEHHKVCEQNRAYAHYRRTK